MNSFRRAAHRSWLLALIAGLLLTTSAAGAADECLECHEDVLTPEMTSFTEGPHGAVNCTGCHVDAVLGEAGDHPEELQKVPCQTCHEEAQKAFFDSVHEHKSKRGDKLAATCVDCHGTHAIRRVDDPLSRVYPLNLPATCGECHNEQTLAKRHDLTVPDAYADYLRSSHGQGLMKAGLLVSASCDDCHGSHDIQPVSHPASPLAREKIPETCGNCHEGIEEDYHTSIHGKLWAEGDRKVPVCTTCHASHSIAEAKDKEFQLSVLGGCGGCHEEQSETYRETYHGQVTALGFVAVAKCYDCHGYHEVRASSDPQSTTHQSQLVSTCAKCHEGANENFAQFYAHGSLHDRENYPVLFYTYLFMTLLLTGVFTAFGIHTVLWLFRALRDRGQVLGEITEAAEDQEGLEK